MDIDAVQEKAVGVFLVAVGSIGGAGGRVEGITVVSTGGKLAV